MVDDTEVWVTYCAARLCSLVLLRPDPRCTTFYLMIVVGDLTRLMMDNSGCMDIWYLMVRHSISTKNQ